MQHCFKLICGSSASSGPVRVTTISLDWQPQLARHHQYSCIWLFQFLLLMSLGSHRSHSYRRRGHGGDRVLDFSQKRRDLLMPSFSCAPPNQSLLSLSHRSNKLLHILHTNLRVYSHYSWFRLGERLFVLRRSLCGGVRDQAGAGRDSVSCSKTL